MTDYYIGQIFENEYPRDAANWCNANNCYIKELSRQSNIRRFEILEQPKITAKERKETFLKDFFSIDLSGYGTIYYRKKPKGYISAIESINTAERMCAKNNGLPGRILIFYQQPNFEIAEQCTEEWLEEHQIILPALSVADFDNLYTNFITAWNSKEHE